MAVLLSNPKDETISKLECCQMILALRVAFLLGFFFNIIGCYGTCLTYFFLLYVKYLQLYVMITKLLTDTFGASFEANLQVDFAASKINLNQCSASRFRVSW